MSNRCTLRSERPADAAAVSAVNTAAFGRADEARLVARLREHAHVYLGLVATDGDAVVGHPAYYPRFGFVRARPLGLTSEPPFPDDAFMVAELTPGVLRGRRGVVVYGEEFDSHG